MVCIINDYKKSVYFIGHLLMGTVKYIDIK